MDVVITAILLQLFAVRRKACLNKDSEGLDKDDLSECFLFVQISRLQSLDFQVVASSPENR